jgi:hypothetical protein
MVSGKREKTDTLEWLCVRIHIDAFSWEGDKKLLFLETFVLCFSFEATTSPAQLNLCVDISDLSAQHLLLCVADVTSRY